MGKGEGAGGGHPRGCDAAALPPISQSILVLWLIWFRKINKFF